MFIMINMLISDSHKKSHWVRNLVAGIAFSVLWVVGAQDVFAQTIFPQDNLKKPNIELAKKNSAIDYVYKNVDMYYPGEKSYIDSLFAKFESQTRLDTALYFLGQMYKDMEWAGINPKQITWSIIYWLEASLLEWKFSNAYDSQIEDKSFYYVWRFDTQYKWFLKRYFDRIQKRIPELLLKIKQLDEKDKQLDNDIKQLDEKDKQLDNDIKQLDEKDKQLDEKAMSNRVQLESIISWFTIADVKKDESIKKMIIDTYNLAIEMQYTPSKHMIELYHAAAQK